MTMSRWDPFSEMMSLRQAMNSLLEDAWIRPGRAFAGEGVHTPLDVAESDQDLTVKAVLPGVKPEDLDITVIGKKAGQSTVDGQTFKLKAAEIVDTSAPYEMVSRMRASFWVLAPLLARCGEAKVSLAPSDAGATALTYTAKAQVGGKIAQLGSRLIDGAAAKMADEFFARFAERVAPGSPAPVAVEPAAEPVVPEARTGSPVLRYIALAALALLIAWLAMRGFRF